MNRKELWKAQGSYKSFNTGKPMLLTMDDKTGATVLEPLYIERTKGFFVKKGLEKREDFIKAIKHREMLGDKLN
jgi:hypothetical protein